MAASATQTNVVRRESRIIERPRLMKLLDETDARTILLLAPASYGKTTLARQWARTLNGASWVPLTRAHRDVAWLADEIAASIDSTSKNQQSAAAVIRQHIDARSNAQRAARDLGRTLADLAAAARLQWVIFDDYQSIVGSDDAEALVQAMVERAAARVLIASR